MDNPDQNFNPEKDANHFVADYTSTPLHFPTARIPPPREGSSFVAPAINNNINNNTNDVAGASASYAVVDLVDLMRTNNNNNNNNNMAGLESLFATLNAPGPGTSNARHRTNTNVSPGEGSSNARPWANTSVPPGASIYNRGDLQWLEPVYGNPFSNVNTPGAGSSNVRLRANTNFTPGAAGTSNAQPSVQLEFQELRSLDVLKDPLDPRHCLCDIVDKSSGVYEIIVQVHGGYRGLEHLLVFVKNTEPLINNTGQYMWGDQDPECNSIEHLFPPLENTNHVNNNAELSATGVGYTEYNVEPSAEGVQTQLLNIPKIYYFDLFGRSVEQLNDLLYKYSIQITHDGQIVPSDTYFAIYNKILKAVDSDKANISGSNGGGGAGEGGGGGGDRDIIIIEDNEDDSGDDEETGDDEVDEGSDEEIEEELQEEVDDEEAHTGRPSVQEQRERTANMTVDDLEPLLHLTELGAANALNISLTTLKLLKNRLYLSRWPYRKINAVNKKLDDARDRLKKKHEAGITTGAGVRGIERKIENLLQERARLYKEALTPMPPPGDGPHPPPGPPGPPPAPGAAPAAVT